MIMTLDFINWLHILFVGPLLLYLGLSRCVSIPEWVWHAVAILGVLVIAYHGYELWIRTMAK